MSEVHDTLRRWMLVDGFDFVADLDRSHGNRMVDKRDGRSYLDMFSCFASMPLGWNHPDLLAMQAELGRVAINNVTNSDVYTEEMARAIDTICDLSMPDHLSSTFFVAGGALAVENALKISMDRKQQQRMAAGLPGTDDRPQVSIAHFEESFHGRSGYTLSLTNTDPVKTDRFSKLDWPRLPNPKRWFPDSAQEQARLDVAEAQALEALRDAAMNAPEEIAAVVIEPIQGEGGDNHFRDGFLQQLQATTRELDALFICDEVQTGVGASGRMWAFEHAGLEPDLVTFGKKMQVCGVFGGARAKELDDNPYERSGRINSTWGGNLIDMVRGAAQLEVIDRDGLVQNAADMGTLLLAGIEDLGRRHHGISNVRGQGLLAAFTLSDRAQRDAFRAAALEEGVIVFNSGQSSIRLRPSLTLSSEEVNEALGVFETAANRVDVAQVA